MAVFLCLCDLGWRRRMPRMSHGLIVPRRPDPAGFAVALAPVWAIRLLAHQLGSVRLALLGLMMRAVAPISLPAR